MAGRAPAGGGVDPETRICVGRVKGAHGVRGQLRITPFTERPGDVAAYGPVSDADGKRQYELKIERMTKTHVIARIDGIDDRDAAEALRGLRLFVPRAALPPADDDEFYCEDLVGLSAETVDGQALGHVLSVQDFGAGDVLELGEARARTFFAPFNRDVVPLVDLAAGRVVIDPPAGLLDEDGGAS
ncbi:MAG: ribosome maturation factor RimM [Alphaproteobacteria bacterium]